MGDINLAHLIEQYGPWVAILAFVIFNVVLIWRGTVRASNREREADVNMQNTVTSAFAKATERADRLQAQLDEQRDKVAVAEHKAEAAQDIATTATAEARTATAEAAQLKSQVERLSTSLESANVINRDNAAMIEVLQSQQAADQDEIKALRATNADQERRLRAVEAERDGLRDDKAANLVTIEALQAQVTALSDELADTRRQLNNVAKRTPTAPLEAIDLTPPAQADTSSVSPSNNPTINVTKET